MVNKDDMAFFAEVINALMPRGLRIAAMDSGGDIMTGFKLVDSGTSATVNPSASQIAVVITLDKTKLTELSVRAKSARTEDGTLPS